MRQAASCHTIAILEREELEQRSATDLAHDHNISRSSICCLLQRFREGGYAS